MHAARTVAVAAALAAPIALTACFGGGGSVTLTVPCPAELVTVEDAAPSQRPAPPVRGADQLPAYYVYIAEAEAYMTAQALQARAREAQVAECREIAAD